MLDQIALYGSFELSNSSVMLWQREIESYLQCSLRAGTPAVVPAWGLIFMDVPIVCLPLTTPAPLSVTTSDEIR